jgi:hypothetical protein
MYTCGSMLLIAYLGLVGLIYLCVSRCPLKKLCQTDTYHYIHNLRYDDLSDIYYFYDLVFDDKEF